MSGSALRSLASFCTVIILLNVFIAVLVEGYSLAVNENEDNGDIHHMYYSLVKKKLSDLKHYIMHAACFKVHPHPSPGILIS